MSDLIKQEAEFGLLKLKDQRDVKKYPWIHREKRRRTRRLRRTGNSRLFSCTFLNTMLTLLTSPSSQRTLLFEHSRLIPIQHPSGANHVQAILLIKHLCDSTLNVSVMKPQSHIYSLPESLSSLYLTQQSVETSRRKNCCCVSCLCHRGASFKGLPHHFLLFASSLPVKAKVPDSDKSFSSMSATRVSVVLLA